MRRLNDREQFLRKITLQAECALEALFPILYVEHRTAQHDPTHLNEPLAGVPEMLESLRYPLPPPLFRTLALKSRPCLIP